MISLNIILLTVSFAFFLIIGVPVAFSLGISAFFSIILSGSNPSIFIQRLFYAFDNYSFTAIFFFMATGFIAQKSGLTRDLVDILGIFLKKVRCGLIYVEIIASTLFGMVSGSTVATVAAIDTIMIPELVRVGFPKRYVVAIACSTGTLGGLIPPSIAAIIFGSIMNVPVGQLLMAYLIPGILIAIGFIVTTYISFVRGVEGFHGFVEDSKLTYRTEGSSLFIKILLTGTLLLSGLVCVIGIYKGIFMATEGGAVLALLIALLGLTSHRLSIKNLTEALLESAIGSAIVMIIISSSFAFSYVVARYGLLRLLSKGLLALSGGNLPILLILIIGIIIILGMFFEGSVLVVLMAPTLGAILVNQGYNIIQFGVVFQLAASIGLITPPVGLCLFTGCSLAKVPIEFVTKYIYIFVAMFLVVTLLTAFIPQISLWLPSL